MSILSLIVVYFLTWWTMIFLVVPSSNERKEEGSAYPDDPKLKYQILRTSLFSLLVTAIIWYIVDLEIFSFREWANEWDVNGE